MKHWTRVCFDYQSVVTRVGYKNFVQQYYSLLLANLFNSK